MSPDLAIGIIITVGIVGLFIAAWAGLLNWRYEIRADDKLLDDVAAGEDDVSRGLGALRDRCHEGTEATS